MQITSSRKTRRRKFQVGTTGWTADDLDRPDLDELWQERRYEIVEGVLTRMPAAYYDAILPLAHLQRLIYHYLAARGSRATFGPEADFIVGRRRVARADLIFMTPEDNRRQIEANAARGRSRRKLRFGRIIVPPTLVVESISPGHEEHDRETKRRWYAEFGVPNYWLLHAYQRSLECLVLDGADYRVDQAGGDEAEVRPALFPGLAIPLAELWRD